MPSAKIKPFKDGFESFFSGLSLQWAIHDQLTYMCIKFPLDCLIQFSLYPESKQTPWYHLYPRDTDLKTFSLLDEPSPKSLGRP